METIEKISEELKNILSEKRYKHSIGTMKMAKKLAFRYKVDVQKASLTGLTHDIAKELKDEERIEYVKKNNIKLDEIEKENPALWHAKIGANMVKQRYGFTEDMQKAIIYHTTAHKRMDKLSKIIYVADKIEETRNYEGVEQLRRLAMQDLNECMIKLLDHAIKKNKEKGIIVHKDSLLARRELCLMKLKKNMIEE